METPLSLKEVRDTHLKLVYDCTLALYQACEDPVAKAAYKELLEGIAIQIGLGSGELDTSPGRS